MEPPAEVFALAERLEHADRLEIDGLLKLMVQVTALNRGVPAREVMEQTFRALPGDESKEEWLALTTETLFLMTRDPTIADDLLDVSRRWYVIVQAT